MDTNELLEHILYELRVANWQRAGGQKSGPPPRKPTPPPVIVTANELSGRRRRQALHLKRRRAERVSVGGHGLEGVNDTISRAVRDYTEDCEAR